jgi:nucleoside-diphosphate-sugar epimerase
MKVLVMGGNRFFGKRLVSEMLQRGADITILNRGQRPDEFGRQVKRVIMDRKKLDPKHPIFAEGQWDIVYDQICYDAHEAEAALAVFQGKVKRYVFISSQSVYGDGQHIPESAFTPNLYKFSTPVNRDVDYGEAKRQAEAVFFQKADFPVTAVRFPIVLGEDDYTERLKLQVKLIHEERPVFIPNIEAKISFIHSQDAGAFLAFLSRHELIGPVNCCAPEPIALRELVHRIEQVVGKDARVTKKEGQGEASPFGITADWFMNTQKAVGSGFNPRPITDWLPSLLHASFAQVASR